LIVLSHRGKATARRLTAASTVIWIFAAILFCLLAHSSSTMTLADTLGLPVISHSMSTIGFSLGAGLPWGRRSLDMSIQKKRQPEGWR